MIVIFKGYTENDRSHNYKWDLTIGKSYDVIEFRERDMKSLVWICDDKGNRSWHYMMNFFSLEEWRNQQIDKLL